MRHTDAVHAGHDRLEGCEDHGAKCDTVDFLKARNAGERDVVDRVQSIALQAALNRD